MDPEAIAFTSGEANKEQHTIVALVASCVPFIKAVLSFVAAQVKVDGMADLCGGMTRYWKSHPRWPPCSMLVRRI